MNYLDLTDAQVLDMASVYGPGMIGHYLYERAEWVKVHNPQGAMGPDALDVRFEPSEKAMQDLAERGMVMAIEVEPVAWEDTDSPTVQVVKRGPGRPRKEK